MSTYTNWMAIREQVKGMWQKCNPTQTEHLQVRVRLLNGPTSGVEVVGVTGTIKQQLTTHGQEVRQVLMDEYASTFPYPRVRIEVSAAPAPYPPEVPIDQQPPAPPIFQPKLPPTTPPTPNDEIMVA